MYIFLYSEMKNGADWNMWNGAGGGVQLQNTVSGVFRPFDQTEADDSEGEEEDDFQMLSFKEIRSTSAGGKTFLKRMKQKGIKGVRVFLSANIKSMKCIMFGTLVSYLVSSFMIH